MAQSKYDLRDFPKSKYGEQDDEWIPETRKSKEKVVCLKCHQVFKSKNKLSVHENTCLNLTVGESFLKNIQPARVILHDIGKIALPSSQIDGTTDDPIQ